MENVQSSTHYKHVSDPASLEGLDDFLDGLLDKVFNPEIEAEKTRDESPKSSRVRVLRPVKQDSENDTAGEDMSIEDLFGKDDIVAGEAGLFSPSSPYTYGQSRSETPSLFEADPDKTVELELKIRFLEAQLDYRNKELRESFNRLKFMEGQILAKDDQIKMIPELIKRGAQATRYECEIESLKDNLEKVHQDLSETQHVLENLRSSWIGKLSLWMAQGGNSVKEK